MNMNEKARILVVDDELPVCKSISAALREEGYGVDMALSGEEALQLLPRHRYEVMIVDLMMPGMSGMDVLSTVRNRDMGISVIMVTGYPSTRTAVQSVKQGAFDYLPKPFAPRELHAVVARVLEGRQLQEESGDSDSAVETAGPGPDGMFYSIPEHCWARIEDDVMVRVGVHRFYVKTLKGISSVHLPRTGESLAQGDTCSWIVDPMGQRHRIWAPVSGTISAVNQELQEDCSAIQRDPYGSGWLILIRADNLTADLLNLRPISP